MRNDPDGITDDMTMTGFVLGTPGYLAPERRSGCPATVQSDLYSVGAVMVEALTGQRLGPGPAPTEQLAPPLRDVARRAMAPDPRDRFASANQMLQSLRADPPRTTSATQAPAPPPSAATTRGGAGRCRSGRAPPPGGTAALTPPRPSAPRRTPRRIRRRRRMAAAVSRARARPRRHRSPAAGEGQPADCAGRIGLRRTTWPQPQTQALTRTTPPPPDSEGSAIRTLATSLASGGLPGDGALAVALGATAAAQPGPDRQASAQQVLSLARVLLDGGGISAGQYHDVVTVLQQTGATVTTTTTSTTPQPSLPGLFFQGHGHGHDRGDGPGGNRVAARIGTRRRRDYHATPRQKRDRCRCALAAGAPRSERGRGDDDVVTGFRPRRAP